MGYAEQEEIDQGILDSVHCRNGNYMYKSSLFGLYILFTS